FHYYLTEQVFCHVLFSLFLPKTFDKMFFNAEFFCFLQKAKNSLYLFQSASSILGMNLFGCKFCREDRETGEMTCDRKNFDSLLWALITVFQVFLGGY